MHAVHSEAGTFSWEMSRRGRGSLRALGAHSAGCSLTFPLPRMHPNEDLKRMSYDTEELTVYCPRSLGPRGSEKSCVWPLSIIWKIHDRGIRPDSEWS